MTISLIGHNGTGTFNLDGGTVLKAGFTVLGMRTPWTPAA